MARPIIAAVLLGLSLAACESEPTFTLGPVTMDCVQGSCLVSFDVTNASDYALPLTYEISLSQDYVRDPDNLVVVGAAAGSIDLLSSETKTVEVEISTTTTPRGSKVSVFDSRAPEFVQEILGL